MKRTLLVAAAGMLLSGATFGYYHFIHYPGATAPYPPVPEKFDLNSSDPNGLPNSTIRFYVAQQGPGTLPPGDSMPALVSQIKLAAAVWNTVPTSQIKLAFGGLSTLGTTQLAPGIDVSFDSDIPPGIRALTKITNKDYSGITGAAFIPILRSHISLRNDLTQYPYDSTGKTIISTVTFDESFFTTMVHEFGHSLGLQHSLTSGAMATGVTRGTTKAKPLTPDDWAGLSVLYPTANFAATTGSITGRVTATDNTGINMASVVVITANGAAVSNLTNPDGSYRIDGIPPGIYYVYVHPLPPSSGGTSYPGDIQPPFNALTANGTPIATRDMFGLKFQPNTYTIGAGTTTTSVDFQVTRKLTVPIYDITTYTFVDNNALKASPLPTGQFANVLTTGSGIVASSGAPVSGLTVQVMGAGTASVTRDANAPGYLSIQFSPPYGAGPRHLIFSGNGDQYVLPYAFTMMDIQPPNISSVTSSTDANGNSTAVIKGTNLLVDTRVLFDGVQTSTLSNNSDGSMTVTLPSAPANYAANVVALNYDGQSSLFVQGNNVTQYTYGGGNSGNFSSNTSSLPAGTESMVQIDATGTNFIDGQVSVGFGSSDIVPRRVFVVSPTRLYVNVGIQAQAPVIASTVTVVSGLQLFSQSQAFQILPQVTGGVLVLNSSLVNVSTGLNGVSAGSLAYLSLLSNISSGDLSTATVLVNGQPAATQPTSDGRLSFTVPKGLTTGPAVLTVQLANGIVSYPIAFNVDAPPPVIDTALAGTSTPIDATHPATPGSLITLIVEGISNTTLATSINVSVGGLNHIPVSAITSPNGTTQVQIVLAATVLTGPQIPVTVGVDTRVSAALSIPIASN